MCGKSKKLLMVKHFLTKRYMSVLHNPYFSWFMFIYISNLSRQME